MTNTSKKFTQVTLFRNKNKKELSKSFEIVSGSVVKNTSANMVDGAYETQAIGDLFSFAAAISRGEIGADTAFAYGVARADLPRTGRVATKKRCGSSAIARTAENFCWRPGEPGVLMCDFDPPRDGRLNGWTPEDYHKLLYDVAPELRDAEMAFTPSASARVLRDGEPVGHGWRGYAFVSDAACIPIYGEMLFRRLVEAGLGWIDISSSGAQLLRTILDASVWQPNRLDFVGRPAIKGAGLQIGRSEPVMFGQSGRPLVMRPDGVALRQWRRTSPIVQNLLGTTAKEAEKQGRRWENERVAAAVASGEQSEARARASYSAARKRGVLGPDFVIYAHDGRSVTVRDILANPRRWHGAAVRHPLEPETGGADYTKIYTEGQARYPVITSLAHGGQSWRLTSAHLAIPSAQKGNAGATDHPGITGIDKEGRLHSNAARETSMTEIHATLESPMKVDAISETQMRQTQQENSSMTRIHASRPGVNASAASDDEDGSSEEKQKATASARRAALKGQTHGQIVKALQKRHGGVPDLESVAERAMLWADAHAPGQIVTLPSGAQRLVTSVELMNKEYALLDVAGQRTCVIHIPDSQPIPWDDFQNRVASRVITGAVDSKGQVKLEPAGKFWRHDCRRREFSKIAFTSRSVPSDTLNLFTSFGVEPTIGCCNKILQHVREVIASGDGRTYNALLDLWAWQLQNVGKPSRIILTLLSEQQQTGKGIIFEQVLPKIWGLHGAVIKDKSHGLDRFNEFMRGKGLVVFDEAAFSGDKKLADRLKGESAATTSAIEGKNLPIITLPAAMNLVLLTNHRHCTHVEQGDMRFWMLEVSDKRRGDHDYFSALGSEIENGGIEAFAAFLLERDVTRFVPQRDVPRETALWEENKIASLDPGDPLNWLLEALDTGGLPQLSFYEDDFKKPHLFDSGPQNVGGAELIAAYRSWCGCLSDRRANACGRNTFWRVMSDLGFASVKGTKGARSRQIPPEKELRTSLKAMVTTPEE